MEFCDYVFSYVWGARELVLLYYWQEEVTECAIWILGLLCCHKLEVQWWSKLGAKCKGDFGNFSKI